jgi:16S rRNA (adenine1518-N6/adenine1519-N6)-dimethyltransferase
MKRHRLGRHYLVDPEVVRKMVAAADLKRTESVVEVGTGKGALTVELAGLCARLDGYEVDRRNYEETLARVRAANVSIHLSDAFRERPAFDVLVSSLPYSRSQDFIEWISQAEYSRAVVLLQEDFVRKVLSPPGSRDYRAVSAISQISSEMREIAKVGRGSFRPIPEVSSMLVVIRPKLRISEEEVSNIKRLFSLRRREVQSALARFALSGRGSYGRRRVYSLTPDEVHGICKEAAGATDSSSEGQEAP